MQRSFVTVCTFQVQTRDVCLCQETKPNRFHRSSISLVEMDIMAGFEVIPGQKVCSFDWQRGQTFCIGHTRTGKECDGHLVRRFSFVRIGVFNNIYNSEPDVNRSGIRLAVGYLLPEVYFKNSCPGEKIESLVRLNNNFLKRKRKPPPL